MPGKKTGCDPDIILTKRKLIENKGTFYISLPPTFVKRHGLQKGDTLPIIVDSIMKIVPMKEID
jgi:hypothetical protein